MKNKRGISGVVVTVLIILISVAAVSAIWITTKPLIDNASNTVPSQQACTSNILELKSCQRVNTTAGLGYNVAYIKTKENKETFTLTKIITILKHQNTILSTNQSLLPGLGELSSTQILTNTTYGEVSIVAEYTLKNGEVKTTCETEKVICQSSQATPSFVGSSGSNVGSSGGSGSGSGSSNNGGSQPQNNCGNGMIDFGEECDGENIGEHEGLCANYGLGGGEVACYADCTRDYSPCL